MKLLLIPDDPMNGAPPHRHEAAAEQPPPRAGIVDIPVLVQQDIEARAKQGELKYGTRLQAGNGRDSLLDLYQEMLDACCYIKQVLVERDAMTYEARIFTKTMEKINRDHDEWQRRHKRNERLMLLAVWTVAVVIILAIAGNFILLATKHWK